MTILPAHNLIKWDSSADLLSSNVRLTSRWVAWRHGAQCGWRSGATGTQTLQDGRLWAGLTHAGAHGRVEQHPGPTGYVVPARSIGRWCALPRSSGSFSSCCNRVAWPQPNSGSNETESRLSSAELARYRHFSRLGGALVLPVAEAQRWWSVWEAGELTTANQPVSPNEPTFMLLITRGICTVACFIHYCCLMFSDWFSF